MDSEGSTQTSIGIWNQDEGRIDRPMLSVAVRRESIEQGARKIVAIVWCQDGFYSKTIHDSKGNVISTAESSGGKPIEGLLVVFLDKKARKLSPGTVSTLEGKDLISRKVVLGKDKTRDISDARFLDAETIGWPFVGEK